MAVLSIPEDTEVAVLEMGMNHFGEISYLTNIGQPDLAVIINIGTMHIEHLGSREGIRQAKLEILEGLQPGGKILLNGDDDMLWAVRNDLNVPVVYFGAANKECAVQASNIREENGLTFDVSTPKGEMQISLALEGLHYVPDSLAAVSVGLQMGVSIEGIVESLSAFQNMAGRQKIFEEKGYTIIKDCYNAGPESMAAALAVLGKRSGRRIAVLGDMLELGERAPKEHFRVGSIAAEKADMLFAYGPNGKSMADGAIAGGMNASDVYAFEDRQLLVNELRKYAQPGDVLLFKGSHGMHMEIALELFMQDKA
jgi:UDP-N-acetylmuramoyl-tripeptide--D-alanyl-D-alanine ligase